jgi:beta-lactamase class D
MMSRRSFRRGAVRRTVPLIAMAAALLAAAPLLHAQKQTDIPRKYLEGHTGAFVLYDVGNDSWTRYDSAACAVRHSPASTFKIPNSLIGLETGVIPDEHFVIPWDGITRPVSAWNRDHDLASAITYSVVPYYQELARHVGREPMEKFVRAFGYGNMDISGPLDAFWLGNSLEISADEQVLFLRKLASGDLPVSRRTLDIVRRILVLQETPLLRGKTGFTSETSGGVIGWFVGYVEKEGHTYIFAFNVTSPDEEKDGEWIREHRKAIPLAVLRDLGIL